MAFFEQLGKKISDAGQGVAQSTKNMADVARLNSSINDKRKQIAADFSALGEKYYNDHKNDPAADQPELIAAIRNLYAEIAQHEEEIKVIRGVTKCPQCGADIPLNAAFCSVCGAAAPAPAPAEGMQICPNCRKQVPIGVKFCTGCGTKLTD